MKITRSQLKHIIKEQFKQVLMEDEYFDPDLFGDHDPVAAAEARMRQGGDDAIRYTTLRPSMAPGRRELTAQPPRPVNVDPPEITYVPGYDPETGTVDMPPRQWTGTSFGTSAGEELFIGPQAEQDTAEDLGQSALEQVIQEVLQNLMEDDDRPSMQQMMHRDFDRPEREAAERRASYSQPTMSAAPARVTGDVIDRGLGAVSTVTGMVPHPIAQGIATTTSAAQHGRRYLHGDETGSEALGAVAAENLPTGRVTRAAGRTGSDAIEAAITSVRATAGASGATEGTPSSSAERPARQRQRPPTAPARSRRTPSGPAPRVTAQAAEPPAETQYVDMPGMEFTARSPSKRDELDLYAEHIQRIIQEEIHNILNEQGVSHEI